jgi:hypothetical protein
LTAIPWFVAAPEWLISANGHADATADREHGGSDERHPGRNHQLLSEFGREDKKPEVLVETDVERGRCPENGEVGQEGVRHHRQRPHDSGTERNRLDPLGGLAGGKNEQHNSQPTDDKRPRQRHHHFDERRAPPNQVTRIIKPTR